MEYIGIDIGGTKVSGAIFDNKNNIITTETLYLEGRGGDDAASLIFSLCDKLMNRSSAETSGIGSTTTGSMNIGISIPGIAYSKTGRVWAPNIPEWDNYPLKDKFAKRYPYSSVTIESDRTCYILGEVSRGAAKGCQNAIFIAVGTGIGAGILIDGRVLHGASDIVGATGWMALKPPYQTEWDGRGCFESFCSGTGIALETRKMVSEMVGTQKYNGILTTYPIDKIGTREIFAAHEQGDPIAAKVIENAIEMWGMAAANFVSLFNPEMVIFGGGVFGPAAKFIDKIYDQALKWAQPIAIRECRFAATLLPDTAGLYGAGAIARMKDKGIKASR